MNAGRLVLLVGFLVIAVGAIVFRDRISGNAGELVAGDCFDVPVGTEIKDVQHHPCNEAHDGEVLLVGKYEGAEARPTQAEFETWVGDNCLGQVFTDYVGATYESREDISAGAFWPTADGWSSGDREVTCYLTPTDEQKITTSYRAAPAAS
jgi:hypothetical protein